MQKQVVNATQLKIQEARYNALANPREEDLQGLCLDWLDYAHPGCIYHASPNGARVSIMIHRMLHKMGTCWGWPDLEIFINGKLVFIELKTPQRKRNPDARQAVVHDALRKQGQYVYVVNNYERFQEIITSHAANETP